MAILSAMATSTAIATAASSVNHEHTITVTSAPQATGDSGPKEVPSAVVYLYSETAAAQVTVISEPDAIPEGHIGAVKVAGIAVGAIAFLLMVVIPLFCYSRRVTRKKREDMASLHAFGPSATPSEAQTAHGSRKGFHSLHSSQSSMLSFGAQSTVRSSDTGGKASFRSPNAMLAHPSPAELPFARQSAPDVQTVRLVKVVRKPSRPDVAEGYKDNANPVEQHDAAVAGTMRMEAARVARERASSHDRASIAGTDGYMTPEPAWRPSSTAGSVNDATATGSPGGTGDGASIHIYYRKSAATIAQATSLASMRLGNKKRKSAMRNNAIPLDSQTSLPDTAR